MSGGSSPESHIVEVLEAAGEPLACQTLRERAALDEAVFDGALARLRGREVVRKLPETDAYRLTYWPESRECILCDEEIASQEYYEFDLQAQGTSTEIETTGLLHAGCARRLFDEASVTEGE